MIITTDDICLSNLKYFDYWLKVKEKKKDLNLICFVIANYKYKEDVSKSDIFKKWFDRNKDWITIGVHGYDHLYPPEGERENFEELVKKSLDILQSFLSKDFLYRAPGFQTTCYTEQILKKLGFAGIAHQERIKYFDGRFDIPFNTHCCDRYDNPITKIWQNLVL